MICDSCRKKAARVRRMTRMYGTGRSAFLVEGVPIVSCGSCGESYLTAQSLKELDPIRRGWRKLAVKRLVPAAKFGSVA